MDYLIHEDGSITGGLELRGLSLECCSEEALSRLRYQTILFLHALPVETELQFLYQIRPFSPVLEKFKAETEGETPEKYRFIWQDSASHMEQHSNIWHTRIFLFLTLPAPRQQRDKTLLSKIKRGLKGMSPQSVTVARASWQNQRYEQMHHAMEKLKTSVALMGLHHRELTSADIGRILYETINPNRSGQLSFERQYPRGLGKGELFVREEIALSGFQRFPREFILDDRIHRIMTLKDIPQRQYLGAILPMLMVREFPFDVIVGFEQEQPDRILRRLQKARNVNANLMNSNKRDENAQHEYEVLQEAIEKLVQGDEKAFQVVFQLHYWGRNEEELRGAEAVLRNSVHQCCEAKEIREEFSYPWSFVGCLPGGFKSVKQRRELHTITPQTLAMLPIFQQDRGASRPVAILKTRTDELAGIDPFNPNLSANNAIIFGPTGRGKSFLAQYLLLHYFRLQPRMIIVDIGGSYRRLTELLGGDYIALSSDSDTALNPFIRIEGEPSPAMLGELACIVERMIKDEGQKNIDRITQHNIRQAILRMYEQYPQHPNFVTLQKCLREMAKGSSDKQDKQICENLSKRLSLWIEGEGRALLVSEETISLEKSVITIDLAGVPSTGDLQAVVMQILASLIRHQVANVNGPKIILFDEVWKHLTDPTAAGVLDELYRTARKRFASVISISQELEDFLNPLVKTSIVKNSETRFILQTIEELPLLEQVFKLNPNELELIKGMTMRRGLYSEVFTMIGESHSVLRVEATPWIYWMCTTHPPDLELERALKARKPGLSTLERIRWLAARHPEGVSAEALGECLGSLEQEVA
jgi:Cdc6-like AAA superfamily ATPase